MKKTAQILALMMAAASSFAAVNESVSIIFPLLDMGSGARAMGMGEAYTAVADDASALYWNAAGLGTVKNLQIAVTYDKWYMDTMFSQALFAWPLPTGTIGADIYYLNMGSITGRDLYGAPTQTINPYGVGGSIGYGISFGGISAGAAVKMISQSMGNISNAAFAGDIGALYKTGIFAAGASLQNIGSGAGYSLPMNIKAGVAVKALEIQQHGLLAALDMQYLFKDAVSLSAGAEYVYSGIVALRLGYKLGFGVTNLEGLKGLSGGIGLRYSNLNFDYAVVPYGDLGTTHRVTLSYMFANPDPQKTFNYMDEKSPVKSQEKTTVKTPAKAAVKTQAVKAKQTPAATSKAKLKNAPASTPVPITATVKPR